MKAAFLEAPQQISIRQVNRPAPAFGELCIKLSKVGICGSDTHLFLGHRLLDAPTIIGHEGLGYIDAIGEGVANRVTGEKIVIEPNIPCRKCKYCLSGRGNICSNKRVLGINAPGCFAEYICVPEAFCWAIPSSISDEDAVTIEPMAVAYHALFAAKALPGDTIAVLGLGAIGLLLTHLALALGYKVLVTELDPSKLHKAVQNGAVPVQTNGTAEAQSAALENIWLQQDVVAVFECAGTAFTASLAAAAAPRGSEIILVGLSEKEASFRPLKIAREGITIVPSIIYHHPFDFKRVIQLIERKIICPGFIISATSSLDELAAGLSKAAEGRDAKIIVEIHPANGAG